MAGSPAHPRLGVVGQHAQHARAAVAADVQPGDDAVAQQERQHVVAVAPLRRRLVDLDQVLEAEHAGRERPVPQQVVEGRQQHRGRGRAGRLRAGRDQHGRAAVGHLEPLQRPVRHQRVDVRPDPGGAAAQAVVLDHAVFGQHAAGAHRAQPRVRAGTRPRWASARPGSRPGSPARAGRTGAGSRCGRIRPGRPPSTARPASAWPASSPTCRRCALPRSPGSRAGRVRGSPTARGRPAPGRGRSPARTSGENVARPSAAATSASRRSAPGRPRAPSTRTRGPVRAASRRCRADSCRRGRPG